MNLHKADHANSWMKKDNQALVHVGETYLPISTAKLPRRVPGSETDGLVAPMIFRPVATTFLPSHTIATTGPDIMYSTKPSKKGFEERSS